VLADPQLLTTAAADTQRINTALAQARASAASPTTSVAAAAADEISVAAAQLFGAHGAEFQGLLAQASEFHDQFASALASAGATYASAENAAANALTRGGGPLPAAENAAIALIMGPSGTPTPSLKYDLHAYEKYISRNFTTGTLQILSTPEGLYPITGVKSEPLNISVNQGITILNNAITQQISNSNTPVVVFGYSQSSIISSLELSQLQASGVPRNDVSFVLVGNEMNPNGGILARFPGLNFTSLGLPFYGGMPTNTGYTVYNYTLEYDGFADFPRYPIDVFADLNAVAGIALVHTTYLGIPQSQIDSAIVLPASPGYDGGSTFYMIPTKNLPLLAPLRLIPYIGNPLADLIQPDLRYLVNWGYGDPNYGWSTSYADVSTPFGLVPPLSATTALPGDLVSGAQQGILAALNDFHTEGLPSLPLHSLATLPNTITSSLQSFSNPLAPSSIINSINLFEQANTDVVGGFSYALSSAYSTLLPTADIANAVVTSLPSYDANLFLDGINQAITGQPVQGIINAIGDPIAADVGILTLAGGLELGVVGLGLEGILSVVP